ncbi:MAG: hypothetical protein ABW167_02945 [Baekduia sp.]
MRKSQEAVTLRNPPAPDYNEEAVEELLDQVKDLAGEERKDAETYGQRAGVLLGFSGVVIGLVTTQARELLNNVDELSDAERWVAILALGTGVLFVVAAAMCSLLVLAPKRAVQVHDDEIENFSSMEALARPKSWHQGRLLRTLSATISTERRSNATRRRWVTSAFRFLLAGIVCLAIHVGVFLVDASDGSECPIQSASATQLTASAKGSGVTSFSFATTSPRPVALTTSTTTSASPFPCLKTTTTVQP